MGVVTLLLLTLYFRILFVYDEVRMCAQACLYLSYFSGYLGGWEGIGELLVKMPLPSASPHESHCTSLSRFFSSFRM